MSVPTYVMLCIDLDKIWLNGQTWTSLTDGFSLNFVCVKFWEGPQSDLDPGSGYEICCVSRCFLVVDKQK